MIINEIEQMKKENHVITDTSMQVARIDKEPIVNMTRKEELSQKVKEVVADMLNKEERPDNNYSAFISGQLQLNYTYLANTFSAVEGMTIEQFIIHKKVEKATELLLSGKYSINQIAEKLHYSSIGHFSNQFKKVKGINPTAYKKINVQRSES